MGKSDSNCVESNTKRERDVYCLQRYRISFFRNSVKNQHKQDGRHLLTSLNQYLKNLQF